jgi:tetratricopeptide (TPR) repeat protein
MLKSAPVCLALVAAAMSASAFAQAQLSPDWTQCVNESSKFTLDVAIGGCSKVINSGGEIGPNLAAAYNRRGNAYHDKNDIERAIADYSKAIEINPRDSVTYNNRGFAYRAQGDNDSAIEDYTKAIGINPRDPVTYNNRGVAYRAKRDIDRAVADATNAIELNPEFADAFNNRGIAYRAKGDIDLAIEDATQAIEINPEFAGAYHNRGIAYRAKGDIDLAIEDATQAIEINPEFASAYYNRGIAYRAKGDVDLAIADYTKAIEINPEFANAYYDRGLAYRAKGDNHRAIVDYTKADGINARYVLAAAAVSIGKAPPSPPPIEKAALTPSDAPTSPFTLVLKTDLSAQQVTVLENHTVVHVWPISSGLQGYATPTGVFQPQSANRMWYSRQYSWTPMPYAVFFIRGVAFHGTNVTSRLGKSASHGCVRLATSNAAQLFDLVHKHGFAKTQIVVYGTPNHDPPAVVRRAPTVGAATTTSNGLPSWAKAVFNQ